MGEFNRIYFQWKTIRNDPHANLFHTCNEAFPEFHPLSCPVFNNSINETILSGQLKIRHAKKNVEKQIFPRSSRETARIYIHKSDTIGYPELVEGQFTIH